MDTFLREFLVQWPEERKATKPPLPTLPKERGSDHFKVGEPVVVVHYFHGIPKAAGLVTHKDGQTLTVSAFSNTVNLPRGSWMVMLPWEYDFFETYPQEFAAWCSAGVETGA